MNEANQEKESLAHFIPGGGVAQKWWKLRLDTFHFLKKNEVKIFNPYSLKIKPRQRHKLNGPDCIRSRRQQYTGSNAAGQLFKRMERLFGQSIYQILILKAKKSLIYLKFSTLELNAQLETAHQLAVYVRLGHRPANKSTNVLN